LGSRLSPRRCASSASACGASRFSGLLCHAVSRSPPGGRRLSLPHCEDRCAAQHKPTAYVRDGSKREFSHFELMSASPASSRHWIANASAAVCHEETYAVQQKTNPRSFRRRGCARQFL